MNKKDVKAAIITGAGSGIGQQTALEFGRHGYHCILVGRDLGRLKETQRQIPGSQTLSYDFNNLKEIPDFFNQQLSSMKSQIRVLVNNAGVFTRSLAIDCPLGEWQRMMNINFLAPVALTNVVLPWMKDQGQGSILNVASTLGLRPIPATSAYSSSKAAMINWTHSLALECGPFGVRANCICPGLVDTPIQDFHHLPAPEKAKAVESMKALQPLGRIGVPEDIARSIYFLAGEDSSWTTGSILNVDGGINL